MEAIELSEEERNIGESTARWGYLTTRDFFDGPKDGKSGIDFSKMRLLQHSWEPEKNEEIDLSNEMFLYGISCGLSLEDMLRMQKKRNQAFVKTGGKSDEVEYPNNRLRIRFGEGDTTSPSPYIYEDGMRIYRSVGENSIHFMVVYEDVLREEGVDEGPMNMELLTSMVYKYVSADSYVPLMSLHTAVMVLSTIRRLISMDETEERDVETCQRVIRNHLPLVVGFEEFSGYDFTLEAHLLQNYAEIARQSRRIIFIPILLKHALSVVDLSDYKTLRNLSKVYASLNEKNGYLNPSLDGGLPKDKKDFSIAKSIESMQRAVQRYRGPLGDGDEERNYLKACSVIFGILSRTKKIGLDAFIGHKGLGHDGVFASFGTTGTVLLVHRRALRGSTTPGMFARHIDFGVYEDTPRIWTSQLNYTLGKWAQVNFEEGKLHRLFLFNPSKPSLFYLSSRPMSAKGLGGMMQKGSSQGNTTNEYVSLSRVNVDTNAYLPADGYTFLESKVRNRRMARKRIYKDFQLSGEGSDFVTHATWPTVSSTLRVDARPVFIQSESSGQVDNAMLPHIYYYPDIYARGSVPEDALKEKRLLQKGGDEDINTRKRFHHILGLLPRVDSRGAPTPANQYGVMDILSGLETPEASMLRAAVRQIVYRSYWDRGQRDGYYIKDHDDPSIMETFSFFGQTNVAFTSPTTQSPWAIQGSLVENDELSGIPETFEISVADDAEDMSGKTSIPVPFGYVVSSWLHPKGRGIVAGPSLFSNDNEDEPLSEEEALRRVLLACEVVQQFTNPTTLFGPGGNPSLNSSPLSFYPVDYIMGAVFSDARLMRIVSKIEEEEEGGEGRKTPFRIGDDFKNLRYRVRSNVLRYTSVLSVLSATADVLKTWTRFARRLDTIVPMRAVPQRGGTHSIARQLERTYGFGIWTTATYVLRLSSEHAMGDVTQATSGANNGERYWSMGNVDHLRALTAQEGKDNRMPATVVAEEIFDEYMREYQRLQRLHWEIDGEIGAFEANSHLFLAERYMYTALRMWHIEARAQMTLLMDIMMMYFSYRRDTLLGSTFSMYATHTLDTVLVSEKGTSLKLLPVNGVTRSYYKHFLGSGLEWVKNEDVMRYYRSFNDQYMRNTSYGTSVIPDDIRTLLERETLNRMDVMRHWAYGPEERRKWVEEFPYAIDYATMVVAPGDKTYDNVDESLRPQWDSMDFSGVKFNPTFTLEGFDPRLHLNLVLHHTLTEKGEEEKGDERVRQRLDAMRSVWNDRTVHAPSVKIRHSGDRLKGNGVFCDDPRGIPPGTFIMAFDGWVVTQKRYDSLVETYPRIKQTYDIKDALELGKTSDDADAILLIASSGNPAFRTFGTATEDGGEKIPKERTHVSRFINTASSQEMANCAVVHWIVDGKDTLWVVNPFTRTIEPGEELLVVYDPVDQLDYFRDFGLYARTPGFVYPPDALHDLYGNSVVTVENYDVQNTRSDPSAKTTTMRSVLRNLKVTGIVGAYQRKSGMEGASDTWHHPARYIGAKQDDARVVQYTRTRTYGTSVRKESGYYGVPTLRPISSLARKYVAPVFKEMARRYGVVAILQLEYTVQNHSYDNVPSVRFSKDAEPVNEWDSALSVMAKTKDIDHDSLDKDALARRITQTLYMAIQRELYSKLDNLSREDKDDFHRQYFDIMENLEDAVFGDTAYSRKLTWMEYSSKAMDALAKAVGTDAGLSLYRSCSMVASNYMLTQSDQTDMVFVQAFGSQAEHREMSYIDLANYTKHNKGIVNECVMPVYTEDADRGVGLYATKAIHPGQPVAIFSGEVVTEETMAKRMSDYHKRHQKSLMDLDRLVDEGNPAEETALRIAKQSRIWRPDPTTNATVYVDLATAGGPRLLVDTSRKGGRARFANHSRYNANVTMEMVLVETPLNSDLRRNGITHVPVPMLVNTFSRTIEAGEEVLWDHLGYAVNHPKDLGYRPPPPMMDLKTFRLTDRRPLTIVVPPSLASPDYMPPEREIPEEVPEVPELPEVPESEPESIPSPEPEEPGILPEEPPKPVEPSWMGVWDAEEAALTKFVPKKPKQTRGRGGRTRPMRGNFWMQHYMQDVRYEEKAIGGDGDCLFCAIKLGLEGIATLMNTLGYTPPTVKDLRTIWANSIRMETFNDRFYLTGEVWKQVEYLQKKINKISTRGAEKQKAKEELQEQIINLKTWGFARVVNTKTKDDLQIARKLAVTPVEIGRNDWLVWDVLTLDDFRARLMEKGTIFGNETAIEAIEKYDFMFDGKSKYIRLVLMNVKNYDLNGLITFEEEKIIRKTGKKLPEVVYCTPESRRDQNPDFYIVVSFSGGHYDLVKFRHNRALAPLTAFTFDILPFGLKRAIAERCVNYTTETITTATGRMVYKVPAGSFASIPDFRKFKRRMGEREEMLRAREKWKRDHAEWVRKRDEQRLRRDLQLEEGSGLREPQTKPQLRPKTVCFSEDVSANVEYYEKIINDPRFFDSIGADGPDQRVVALGTDEEDEQTLVRQSEGALLAYGRGMFSVKWSQMHRIMGPNTIGGSRADYRHKPGVPKSIELLKTFLKVEGELHLSEMTPLSRMGDLLHHSSQGESGEGPGLGGLDRLVRVSGSLVGNEATSDAITKAWTSSAVLFHTMPMHFFPSVEQRMLSMVSLSDFYRENKALASVVTSLNHALDDVQERMMASVHYSSFISVPSDNAIPSRILRTLLYTVVCSWRQNALLLSDYGLPIPVQLQRLSLLCDALGITALVYPYPGDEGTFKTFKRPSPDSEYMEMDQVYDNANFEYLYTHAMDACMIGNDAERKTNVHRSVFTEGRRPTTAWEYEEEAKNVLERWKARSVRLMSNPVPTTQAFARVLSAIERSLRLLAEPQKTSVNKFRVKEVKQMEVNGKKKLIAKYRVITRYEEYALSNGKIVYVRATSDSVFTAADKPMVRLDVYQSKMIKVAKKSGKGTVKRPVVASTTPALSIDVPMLRREEGGGVGESVRPLPRHIRHLLKAVKRVYTDVQHAVKRKDGRDSLFRPSPGNFTTFRVYVESMMDYLILVNVYHLRRLANQLVVARVTESQVLQEMYTHCKKAVDRLLDQGEENRLKDYAAFQRWKQHREVYSSPSADGKGQVIRREHIPNALPNGKKHHGQGSAAYFMLVRMAIALTMGKSLKDLVHDPLLNNLGTEIEEGVGFFGDPWWSDSREAMDFWASVAKRRMGIWRTLLSQNEDRLKGV